MALQTQHSEGRLDWLIPDDAPQFSPEEETQAALEEMRRDVTAHLTTPVLRILIGSSLASMTEIAQILAPHLVRCFHCRHTLRQTLEIADAAADDPAALLLAEADEAARWQAAAGTATDAARQTLLDQGIGYVYGRDDGVYRRLPDGQEEVISTPNTAAL